MHVIPEVMREHPYRSIIAAGVLIGSLMHHSDTEYIDFRGFKDAAGGHQWPLAIDSPYKIRPSEQTDEYIEKFHTALRSLEEKTVNIPWVGGQTSTAADTSSYHPADRLADKTAVKQAAEKLKSAEPPQQCPEPGDSKFRVPYADEGDDPYAAICLQANDLRVESSNAGTTVVFHMAADDRYTHKENVDLPAAFKDFSQPECRARTDRLAAFGRTLIEAAGPLPEGQTADVAITVAADSKSPCDTWPRPETHPLGNR